MGAEKVDTNSGVKIKSRIIIYLIFSTFTCLQAQINKKNIVEYKNLKKRVYNFTKIDFVTSEGEFNESICTLLIPDLRKIAHRM